jgi:hypothetical protein
MVVQLLLSLQCAVVKLDCAPGKFAQQDPIMGGIFCYVCPAGKFQGNTGQNSCVVCPEGRFSTTFGALSQSDCTLCHTKASNAKRTACEYPRSCGNSVHDDSESDIDCGGQCAPCTHFLFDFAQDARNNLMGCMLNSAVWR